MIGNDLIDGILELVVYILSDDGSRGDNYAHEFLRDVEYVEDLEAFKIKLGPIHESIHFMFNIDFCVGLADYSNQKVKQNDK